MDKCHVECNNFRTYKRFKMDKKRIDAGKDPFNSLFERYP